MKSEKSISHKESNTNHTNAIVKLKTQLQGLLGSTKQIAIEEKKVQEFPFILVSINAKEIITAYTEGKKIGGVPLDKRRYGKMVFDDHINALREPDVTKVLDRHPLLCNQGIAGSGKSVQQALNMHWFTDRFKNGVAIEITFNDDAANLLMPDIENILQFRSALVRGIILRLIEFCNGRSYSIDPTAIMDQYLSWDFLPMLGELYPVGRPLKKSLMFVRDVLGLPDDAPILLAVDELIKLDEEGKNLSKYLNFLCREMDASYREDVLENRDRTFWLSVSAYGCFPLTRYITTSNREINLQPLSPIFPITHNLEKFNTLPPILQCFKKENRKKIKPTKNNLKLLKELSLLMMQSGGHPRRVSALLFGLSKIEFKIDYLMSQKKYDDNYVDSKIVELKDSKLVQKMNAKFPFVVGSVESFAELFLISNDDDQLITYLISLMKKGEVIDKTKFPYDHVEFVPDFDKLVKILRHNEPLKEKVCQNMVEPFPFSSLAKDDDNTFSRKFLEFGYASYVQKIETINEGFLFVLYPFLEIFQRVEGSFPFVKSMIAHFNSENGNRGKNLEICVCDALNFYSKNRTSIKLSDICSSNGGGEVFSWQLEKIPYIPETTLIECCPSVLEENRTELKYVAFDDLVGLSPGFYHPTNEYNNTADVIGILNVKKTNNTNVKRLILFIQLKDWFKDTVSEKVNGRTRVKNIVDEWRWSQQFATESDVYLTRKCKEKSMNQFNAFWKEHEDHMPVFLLFSANKIESISTGGKFSNVRFHRTTQNKKKYLRENEGTLNLEHSKNWFPTFGYNMQAAQLQQISYGSCGEHFLAKNSQNQIFVTGKRG